MAREVDTRDLGFSRLTDELVASMEAAAADVSGALPGLHTVQLEGMNNMTGTPSELLAKNAPPAPGPLIDTALRYVSQVGDAMGFEAGSVAEFVPDPTVLQTSSQSSAVHLQQTYRGIPVYEMVRTVRFSPQAGVTGVAGDHVLLEDGLDIVPRLDVSSAVLVGARHIAETAGEAATALDGWGEAVPEPELDIAGWTPRPIASFPLPSRPTVLDRGPFEHPIPAHLVIFYQGPAIRVGWHMVLTMPGDIDAYEVIVGSDETGPGEILYCKSAACSAITAHVYTECPGRTPRSPVSLPRAVQDYPLPLPNIPDFPAAWCVEDESRGNACVATLGDRITTLRARPEGEGVLFQPENEEGDEQKILNIFYFCNYMHDFFYMLGFDESAGNFQQRNFTTDGLAGDPVLARAHPGPVYGTANMLTDPDGLPPRMNMGLKASSGRHTAFDADVVFHEYVHGVTNRLVGGRMNTSALRQPQSRGMGEGWADYFALTIQNYGREAERVTLGDWVTGNPNGMRGQPYTDEFPDTYADLGQGRYAGQAPHNIGEIWCAMLMSMNRRLGEALGTSDRGHQLGWQLVVDALKLTPASPSFLDARDAILRALDGMGAAGRLDADTYVVVTRALWTNFARYGMGPAADSAGASLSGIVPDFAVPADL